MSTHVIQHELSYFKRYRMELDLTRRFRPCPQSRAIIGGSRGNDSLLSVNRRRQGPLLRREIDRFVSEPRLLRRLPPPHVRRSAASSASGRSLRG